MTPARELHLGVGVVDVNSALLLSGSHSLGYGVSDPKALDNAALARLARTLIGRHFARLCRGTELAALLNVDDDRLAMAFRDTYGMTLEKAIAREKFKMAQRLLAQTSLGLPQIAARVGFAHPSTFATAFREFIGISPWAFRQLPYLEQIAAIEQDED